jgi:hypothetical protein
LFDQDIAATWNLAVEPAEDRPAGGADQQRAGGLSASEAALVALSRSCQKSLAYHAILASRVPFAGWPAPRGG